MAQAFSVPSVPYSCSQCSIHYISNLQKEGHMVPVLTLARAASSRIGVSRVSIGSHLRRSDTPTRQRRLNAVDTRIVEDAPTRTAVEIPVTCYQVAFHNLPLSTVIVHMYIRICVRARARCNNLVKCLNYFLLHQASSFFFFFKKKKKNYEEEPLRPLGPILVGK
jgi:hypothetical protein